jgi:hypothetical protein
MKISMGELVPFFFFLSLSWRGGGGVICCLFVDVWVL